MGVLLACLSIATHVILMCLYSSPNSLTVTTPFQLCFMCRTAVLRYLLPDMENLLVMRSARILCVPHFPPTLQESSAPRSLRTTPTRPFASLGPSHSWWKATPPRIARKGQGCQGRQSPNEKKVKAPKAAKAPKKARLPLPLAASA